MKVDITAPNNCVIFDGSKTYCQSYSTIIALMNEGEIYLDPKHDCSTTTAKHRNKFLSMTSAEVKAKIKSGEFKIKELNR